MKKYTYNMTGPEFSETVLSLMGVFAGISLLILISQWITNGWSGWARVTVGLLILGAGIPLFAFRYSSWLTVAIRKYTRLKEWVAWLLLIPSLLLFNTFMSAPIGMAWSSFGFGRYMASGSAALIAAGLIFTLSPRLKITSVFLYFMTLILSCVIGYHRPVSQINTILEWLQFPYVLVETIVCFLFICLAIKNRMKNRRPQSST